MHLTRHPLSTMALLVAASLLLNACGGGGGTQVGPSLGKTAIVLRDGPIQTIGDDRTITSVWIDVRRVELDRRDGQAAGEEEDGVDDEGEDGTDRQGEQADDVEDQDDAVVFDIARGDNGGVPLRLDLLSLTTSGALLSTLDIRVGTYDKAEVEVDAAFAEFEDDPGVLVPLVLMGDDNTAEEFEFQLDPPVTVSESGVTVAVIDFVPVVTFDGADYLLAHDRDDTSGEHDGDADVEVEGVVSVVGASHDSIEVDGFLFSIDVSTAVVRLGDASSSKDALAIGQRVEIEGILDPVTGILVATRVVIEDERDD